jgi:peroxiredoxin
MKWTVALSACCVVLLGVNIALIHQNSQLKAQLSLPPPVMEAATGTQVPDLRGVDLEGKPIEVLYGKDSRKVLVMVFSPTCPFCDQNWPKWQQVISSLDRSAIRPVLVDVTSTTTANFVSQHQLSSLPVILKADASHAANNPGGSQWKSGEGLDWSDDGFRRCRPETAHGRQQSRLRIQCSRDVLGSRKGCNL